MTDMPMWRPPVDQPLDSDPAIQLVLNAWRRRKVVRPVFTYVALAALMFLTHRGFSALGVLFVVGAGVTLAGVFQFRSRVGWWLPSAPALLEGAVAARVRSEVVGGAGAWTLLSIDGGQLCLRLTNGDHSVRQLLARQTEVSMVGPTADGVAAVVVDGLPVPLPARVVPTPAAPTPVAATGEDLPRIAAAKAVRAAWLVQVVTSLLGACLVYDVAVFFGGWQLALAGFAFVLITTTIAGLIRRNDQRRLVKLLDNGPWQAYPVQLLSWTGNPALVGRLRLALIMPDGNWLPVTAKLGASWLVANITATGYLWVAGTPRYGVAAAAGVPGQPNIAAVRFEETQAG
ncbi:hypothetical protein [Kutzneria sp. NPDC052558]|uniref:hypothetical protein n=1 Tax=Kutzneria sp. NPDC052558 TaxID=3364121 RepID=UPI0037C80D9E